PLSFPPGRSPSPPTNSSTPSSLPTAPAPPDVGKRCQCTDNLMLGVRAGRKDAGLRQPGPYAAALGCSDRPGTGHIAGAHLAGEGPGLQSRRRAAGLGRGELPGAAGGGRGQPLGRGRWPRAAFALGAPVRREVPGLPGGWAVVGVGQFRRGEEALGDALCPGSPVGGSTTRPWTGAAWPGLT